MPQYKFMQVLERDVYDRLVRRAKKRGIGIQQLIRAVIIPEWEQHQDAIRRVNARIRKLKRSRLENRIRTAAKKDGPETV